MSSGVKIVDNTKKVDKRINKAMRNAFTDVVLDVKRVSSASAPHDSGFLEKNKHTIKNRKGTLVGEVSFEAKNDGFDYAEWTHNADYDLGEKSKRKGGGKSKYGSGSIPVGKNYLGNTVEMSEKGYMEYLTEAFIGSVE